MKWYQTLKESRGSVNIMPTHVSVSYWLTPWGRVLPEKLTGSRLVKKFPHFMENEGSLPHSLVPILSQINPVHALPFHFLNIYLNIILPTTPGSPKWSLYLRFPHQNPVYVSSIPHPRYMPRPSHSSLFCHQNNIEWGVQITKLFVM